ncbi:hypothetical protein HPP92_007574 [Vanilla planifolia]|uniref:Methylenetetrahydrofolate reductase n=1 Tax=Vanilla planifolia TaxID=51239 RepID=A0A835RM82_VANPL|nr:hypothetical protein HPP92_007574 [Vanilla planifolia]
MKVIEKIRDAVDGEGGRFSPLSFPPKDGGRVENLFDRMDRMVAHNPSFCDITWGAGGSTAELTLDIANRMQNMRLILMRFKMKEKLGLIEESKVTRSLPLRPPAKFSGPKKDVKPIFCAKTARNEITLDRLRKM